MNTSLRAVDAPLSISFYLFLKFWHQSSVVFTVLSSHCYDPLGFALFSEEINNSIYCSVFGLGNVLVGRFVGEKKSQEIISGAF